MNPQAATRENMPMPAAAPRIVAVAPQMPLAEVAAEHIFRQHRAEDAAPEALTSLLILVPTRRAGRALREALLRRSDGVPLLLPRIQPIGEAAEDEMVFAQLLSDPASTEALLALPPAMEAAERALRMTELLKRLDRDLPLEQIAKLAVSLLEVLDDCQRYGCSPESLRDIVPEALAMHWQKVLMVLNVIWEHWPGILREADMQDPIRRRDALLDLLVAHWERLPPAHPVIAVGTFGTQAASRRLLKAVAHLPQGLVMVPDMQAHLPEEAWEAVDATHPADALKQLLAGMNESRACLELWGTDLDDAGAARAQLWQEVLLPAAATERWRAPSLSAAQLAAAVGGMHRILAPHPALEAQTIALLLREALETPGKTAALVTPDRQLAAQVAAQLAVFGVGIDDSAGMPVLRTPAGRFVQLVMDAASARFAPVPLLSLLHHPFAQGGMERGAWLGQVRMFEKHCLRGLRPAEGLAGLREALARRMPKAPEELTQWLDLFCTLMAPLDDLFHRDEPQTLAACMECHLTVAGALSTTPEGEIRLWEQPESPVLARVLEGLRRHSPHLAAMPPQHYPPLLVVLMAGDAWRPNYGAHPRLQILSPQEARLQRFDRLILGGLNEGTWPVNQETGPWLSRPMRESAGLGLTETSLGLQALDFFQLALTPELYLTYSAKKNNSGALPSRYLQRLDAVLKSYAYQGIGSIAGVEETRMLRLAERLLHWSGPVSPEARPAPKPPLVARPRTLAVTRIDTLIRDPYSLYASHILRLKPLDPLDAEPEAAAFGLMLHRMLERLTKDNTNAGEAEIAAAFDALAQGELAQWDAYPLLQSLGREQVARLREWLLPLDAERRAEAQKIVAEMEIVHGWESVGGAFTLTAKVDRTEYHTGDGAQSLRLVDYKSGQPPKLAEMMQGRANQIPLQGWMVREGAMGQGRTAELEFWKLKEMNAENAVETLSGLCLRATRSKTTPEALIEAAGERVKNLIAAYDRAGMPYSAAYLAPNTQFGLEYAHLARQGEWE